MHLYCESGRAMYAHTVKNHDILHEIPGVKREIILFILIKGSFQINFT